MQRLWVLVTVQAAVAAASLVVEIVAGRMLAPYVGMSLYTWTSVIAVVLAGFSVGHWVGGALAERTPAAALRANGWAMVLAAVTTAGAVFLLRWTAGPVITALDHPVAAIVALTVLVFFLPSFFAGIPAPILTRIAVLARPEAAGRALGAMFAAGALGAIFGTLAAGFLFISWLGSVGTLAAVTMVYALLAAQSFLAASSPGVRGAGLGLAALVLPLGVAGAALLQPDPCTRESDYFCIRVVELSDDPDSPVRLMVLDHLVHGITDGADPQAMLTPHGMMQDGLSRMRMEGRADWSGFVIGGGTYTVPRAWAARGGIDVTVAEIDPVVTEVAVRDFWFDPAGARVIHADARAALRAEPTRYDIILGDAFTDIAAPPHLITREFFRLVQSRLNADGAFVMTVIDHMDRLEMLAALVHTLRQDFAAVEVWADPSHPATEQRRVFLIVAAGTLSPVTRISHHGPAPREAVRVAATSVDRILAARNPLVLTDDYAPVDRLMGGGH